MSDEIRRRRESLPPGPAWAPSAPCGGALEDLPLGEVVGQALGTASTCWADLAGAGEFDSARCAWVLDGLMAYLNRVVDGVIAGALRAAAPATAAGTGGRWPFTAEEARAVRAAYAALTRVGDVTAVPGGGGDRTVDGWDGIVDRAHHDLGLLLLWGRLGWPPGGEGSHPPV